jgi:hypothetical protein
LTLGIIDILATTACYGFLTYFCLACFALFLLFAIIGIIASFF